MAKIVVSTSYMANNTISKTDTLVREEARRRGHQCVFVNPKECSIVIRGWGISIRHRNEIISDADAMLVKRTKGMEVETYKLAKAMERMGIRVVDTPNSLLLTPEKILPQLQRIGSLPMPSSLFANCVDKNTLDILQQSDIGFPFIIKPQTGTRSRGVKVIKRASDLAKYECKNEPVLIQEMLDIKDKYRVIIINGVSLGCWVQGKNEGKRRYARMEPAEKLALQATKLQLGDIWGVDIIKTDMRLYVLECNRNPGFSSFNRVSKMRIEKHIVDYLLGKKVSL